jgi:hypothetical protein
MLCVLLRAGFMSPHMAQFIKTPFFMFNSRFDAWQLANINQAGWKTAAEKVGGRFHFRPLSARIATTWTNTEWWPRPFSVRLRSSPTSMGLIECIGANRMVASPIFRTIALISNKHGTKRMHRSQPNATSLAKRSRTMLSNPSFFTPLLTLRFWQPGCTMYLTSPKQAAVIQYGADFLEQWSRIIHPPNGAMITTCICHACNWTAFRLDGKNSCVGTTNWAFTSNNRCPRHSIAV